MTQLPTDSQRQEQSWILASHQLQLQPLLECSLLPLQSHGLFLGWEPLPAPQHPSFLGQSTLVSTTCRISSEICFCFKWPLTNVPACASPGLQSEDVWRKAETPGNVFQGTRNYTPEDKRLSPGTDRIHRNIGCQPQNPYVSTYSSTVIQTPEDLNLFPGWKWR